MALGDWQPLGCGADSVQAAATEIGPSCSSPQSCADVDNLLTVLLMRSSTESATTLSPSLILCYAGTWEELLWTGVDGRGCFWSVEDFSIIKLQFPVDSNFQLWQNTWGKMVNIKRELKCFSILLGNYFGIRFRWWNIMSPLMLCHIKGDWRLFLPEQTSSRCCTDLLQAAVKLEHQERLRDARMNNAKTKRCKDTEKMQWWEM